MTKLPTPDIALARTAFAQMMATEAAARAMLAALDQMRAFVGVTHGEGPEAAIPETVPSRLGFPVKLGAIVRTVDAAIAQAEAAGIKAESPGHVISAASDLAKGDAP